ncbi:ABC transporter substrate-binding protein [Phyllobacterium sp. SB3]|uniref:ABC transporter substrate-binding protein n=1 Tax=Phyllobacterium sp. SB3 TaxID=3156073 RepID=UPI0032AE8FE6
MRLVFAGICLGASVATAYAQMPSNYPMDYNEIVNAAKDEGKVVIFTSANGPNSKFIVQDFEALYPGVSIELNNLSATEVYSRFLSQEAASAHEVDILWSNAMDLQMKLVSDGYAMSYTSPENAALPDWAKYQNQAYGTTLDPAVLVYNKRLIDTALLPKTHDDLVRTLGDNANKLTGKLTTYDLEASGAGYNLAYFESKKWPGYWDLISAQATAKSQYYQAGGTMVEKVAAGEYALGFNLPYPYAKLRQRTDPNVGIHYTSDYVLAISRIALIVKDGPHPNAAKLFLDYILSKRGQDIMANKADFVAIRTDVAGESTAAQIEKEIGDRLAPIPVDVSITEGLDPIKRRDFIARWKRIAR